MLLPGCPCRSIIKWKENKPLTLIELIKFLTADDDRRIYIRAKCKNDQYYSDIIGNEIKELSEHIVKKYVIAQGITSFTVFVDLE